MNFILPLILVTNSRLLVFVPSNIIRWLTGLMAFPSSEAWTPYISAQNYLKSFPWFPRIISLTGNAKIVTSISTSHDFWHLAYNVSDDTYSSFQIALLPSFWSLNLNPLLNFSFKFQSLSLWSFVSHSSTFWYKYARYDILCGVFYNPSLHLDLWKYSSDGVPPVVLKNVQAC